VSSDRAHLTVVEDDDLVGTANRGEAVRDDEQRAFLGNLIDRAAEGQLVRGIQMRGRLVEQKELRPDEQRARDRDALALAAGEHVAVLSDLRVQSVGKPRHQLGEVGQLHRSLDLIRSGPRSAVGDVVAQRAVQNRDSCSTSPIAARRPSRVERSRSTPFSERGVKIGISA
jgi:hypothetical protein